MNNSEKDIVYLCIGETAEFPDEKILYPLNPLRHQECVRKNWAWLNPPQVPWGKQSGKPKDFPKGHLVFRIAKEKDADEVLEIYRSSPDYFLKVDGCLPTLEMATRDITSGPEQRHPLYFKEFLFIERDGEVIGVADIHLHHREEKVCYLGLLLISQDLLRKGIGTQCYQLLEHYIQKALSCEKILLGVSHANQVGGFWTKMGYAKNGRKFEWSGEKKTSSVDEYEKIL